MTRLFKRAAKRTITALVAFAALTLGSERAFAAGDPELEWWTLESPHFRIHFDRSIEVMARRVLAVAEAAHSRVAPAMSYTAKERTEIALTDDTDSANGSATALPRNVVRLYVTAPGDLSDLGDYDDWYTALVTHEYTHIAHLANISGLPAIVNAILGTTLAPNQAQPRWITEGFAVVSESRHTSGGRIRSSMFDMYLRADVLEDRIAGLDQISSSPYRWPGGNLWYLYGSRFWQWITDVYGPSIMPSLSASWGSETIPLGLNRAIRNITGRTYVQLYEGFKDYLRRLYRDQVIAVAKRGLREGARITQHGRGVYYPRFLPAREGKPTELVYYRSDDNTRTGIYRIGLETPREGERLEELLARTSGASTSSFTPEGGLVFDSTSVFRNFYSRSDLFSLPHGTVSPQGDEPVRKRLTTGLRAQQADMSPDGTRIVFTVNVRGTTFLEIADVTADGTLQNRRDLVPSGRYEQAYTPRFSPDGKKVAYSAWTNGGYRDIRIVDVATGAFEEIAHDRAIDMTPVWSPKGGTIYFSSDRTGIFNVYAFDVKTKALAQVTNVRTGAVMPAISNDGKTLVYVGYGTYGYDLYTMPLDPGRYLDALPVTRDRPPPPPEPAEILAQRTPYNPINTLGPRAYSLDLAPGIYSAHALTISTTGSDIAGHHTLGASIKIEPDAPSPAVNVDYAYGRLPFDFNLHLFHSVVPRGGYYVNNQEIHYDEQTNGITTGLSYSHRGDFDQHDFGLSYSVANFKGTIPVGSKIDPYSVAQRDPPQGNINTFHLGYGFHDLEGAADAIGAVRGIALWTGFDYASPYTGSSYTVLNWSYSVAGYFLMPWRGNQTLALRTAGGVTTGDYPRGGAYFVGGYDLPTNSLPSMVLSGVYDGSFVLRGYPASVYYGSMYTLTNIEYRVPIAKVDRGLSTLPLYLKRLDGNLFVDYGGAFNHFDLNGLHFFHHGAIIDSAQLHCSVGGELWLGGSVAYTMDTQLRLGYAYGFSAEALRSGQFYLVASAAF